ncbi:hypothetical protein MASR1M65_03730 [Saprospiraceae bacterium]
MEKVIIPAWKKWLSWLFPIRLEESSSDFNDLLVVSLSKGRLQLLTENAIYSFDDLYDNFDFAFSKLRLDNINETLVLGLGLGSIPYLLEKKYGIHTNITAVEIDEEIIYLAGKYSLHRLKNPTDCICTRAEIFLDVTEEKFDLICMDVFVDEQIPEVFLSTNFLETIREKIKPGGIFLFNHLATSTEDKEKAQLYFDEIFLSVFPAGKILKAPHNYILLQDKTRAKA